MRTRTAPSTLLLAGLLATLPASGCAARAQTPSDAAATGAGGDLVLVGVRVVDVRSGVVLPDRTVVIEDGRIRSVGRDADLPAGTETVDAGGRYLIPGLWDAHAHVRHPAAPDVLFPLFVAHGVTGIREMSSDCDGPEDGDVCVERMKEWRRAISTGEMTGPRLVALSSFPLDPPWGYEVPREMVAGMLDELDSRGLDLIKTYNRLSPDAFRWFVEGARERGMDAAGHVPLRITAAEASDAGLRSVEHARAFLFDCYPGSQAFRSSARSVNVGPDDLRAMVEEHDPAVCAETFRTLERNGTWYVPTHVTRRMEARAGETELRNDPRLRWVWGDVREQWHADADRVLERSPTSDERAIMDAFYRKGLELTGRAHEAGVPIAVGTDAGDSFVFWGSSVHDEMAELVKAGLSPAEALAAATLRPAELMRAEEDHGTVEAGKRADLVLLRANPLADIDNTRTVEAVIFDGRLLDRGELDGMLESVEEAVRAMDR